MRTGLRLFWLQYVNVRLVFCVGVQVRTHSAKRLITIQAAKVQKKSHICKHIGIILHFFFILGKIRATSSHFFATHS